jgi:predicted 3-demethylubiquinone-9 3-methyltransferase (glyoxalase superfamily)
MPELSAKIVPHLWFANGAKEAAEFYVSIFPDSRIDRVVDLPADSPSGPAGTVQVVGFTIARVPFIALAAGPLDPFNHAISFVVRCTDQAEIDHYWRALSEGGSTEACGWLKDRYGVSWQIVPVALEDFLADTDRAKARRAAEAMLKMGKIEIAKLYEAAEA